MHWRLRISINKNREYENYPQQPWILFHLPCRLPRRALHWQSIQEVRHRIFRLAEKLQQEDRLCLEEISHYWFSILLPYAFPPDSEHAGWRMLAIYTQRTSTVSPGPDFRYRVLKFWQMHQVYLIWCVRIWGIAFLNLYGLPEILTRTQNNSIPKWAPSLNSKEQQQKIKELIV